MIRFYNANRSNHAWVNYFTNQIVKNIWDNGGSKSLVHKGKPEGKTKFSQLPAFRVGLLLVIFLAAFALVQQLSVPETFGQYGYYRGDNVSEWAGMEVSYAEETNTCSACHAEKYNTFKQTEHGQMQCQTCHGAAKEHTLDPGTTKPTIEPSREFCGNCHFELEGRKETVIKQVGLDHNGETNCVKCHDPHEPWSMFGGGK